MPGLPGWPGGPAKKPLICCITPGGIGVGGFGAPPGGTVICVPGWLVLWVWPWAVTDSERPNRKFAANWPFWPTEKVAMPPRMPMVAPRDFTVTSEFLLIAPPT